MTSTFLTRGSILLWSLACLPSRSDAAIAFASQNLVEGPQIVLEAFFNMHNAGSGSALELGSHFEYKGQSLELAEKLYGLLAASSKVEHKAPSSAAATDEFSAESFYVVLYNDSIDGDFVRNGRFYLRFLQSGNHDKKSFFTSSSGRYQKVGLRGSDLLYSIFEGDRSGIVRKQGASQYSLDLSQVGSAISCSKGTPNICSFRTN